ncbi:MAG TPA: class I SAM-dependent methyltransferase [Candidatus Binatia bacterium]|nr:class I SAM-dependent methyltransferase [Candidatus Binatia bacterium]
MTDEGNRKREESRRVFSEAASIYDRVGPPIFSHFGQRLVDVSAISLGANVLDVAAGRGAVLFPVAAKVGSSGRVMGIDFSAAMVKETAKDIASRKIANAEIRQMDAEQMMFDDAAFDCVTCGFAVWMFAEPARVLQEFRRVLRPGGQVALSTWAVDNPAQTWCHEVLRPFVAATASQQLAKDLRFDTPLQLETLLRHSGFEDIQITIEEMEFVYRSEEQYWSSLWSSGLRRPLEKMTADLLVQAKSEVLRKFQSFRRPDGFHRLSRALFACAKKPTM